MVVSRVEFFKTECELSCTVPKLIPPKNTPVAATENPRYFCGTGKIRQTGRITSLRSAESDHGPTPYS
jgi:hypothetical protein